MDKTDLINKLRAFPQQLDEMTRNLSDGDLTTPFLMKEDGTAEWTVAQNVHHVADSHMNSYVRCMLVLTENEPTIRPYDQDGWAARPEAQAADLSYSLAILASLHNRWALMFENLSDAQWARIGHHPVGGPFSMADQLKNYVEHGEGHLDQIQRTLEAKGR